MIGVRPLMVGGVTTYGWGEVIPDMVGMRPDMVGGETTYGWGVRPHSLSHTTHAFALFLGYNESPLGRSFVRLGVVVDRLCVGSTCVACVCLCDCAYTHECV